MHDAARAGGAAFKERVPADLVTALLARRDPAANQPQGQPLKLSAKIYGVMAATALLTFVSLVHAYELFFAYQLYA